MFRHYLSERFWDRMKNGIGHSFRDDGSILLVKYERTMLLLSWSWLDLKMLQFYDPMDQLR